ncbi:AAA family ATPase [Dawidia soli]|uniref:AAA family ATPase n=1 Tax=Dawidia soli TaxID=2782352 RepID=A0AAP2D797_9BACT|nr:AAA family ATPase [Dawidia soli]MBT1686432.1 AAA family ATPase [Dawidia soli]
MYIKEVEIKNIRSIKDFKMEFPQYAGWHVLIGDNGAGKSSIIRSIALALVGPEEALGLRADWRDWLNHQEAEGRISLSLANGEEDKQSGRSAQLRNFYIPNEISFHRINDQVTFSSNKGKGSPNPMRYNWGYGAGWFSVAYGPYRRFAGGNPEWTKVFYSQPKLGAHLSAFGEDIALTEATEWLVKLNYQILEGKEPSDLLDNIKRLINSVDFLPHKAEIESISSDGVTFKDGNGSLINVNQLSDGYRSVLSLTFELIRQLVRVYGSDAVFKDIKDGDLQDMRINLPGVVLIDEVDAHLHPTWQTRIGQWFTKYFPNIQFIVTTHSPLICRASDKGTIWRLAAPGNEEAPKEVTGDDRNRLIYGNVLDAYGTEIFGSDVSISLEAVEKKEELVTLSKKKTAGVITSDEEGKLNELRKTFSTDDPVDL